MRLAHPAGDQLGVLGAVVDDEDEVGLHASSLEERNGPDRQLLVPFE